MSRSNARTVSLRDRMLLASIALAAIVVGVFVATILAVSAARTATHQEARSKNLSVAALRLEKLVLDVENGVRGYALTKDPRFLTPYTDAKRALPEQRKRFRSLATDQPLQAARAKGLDEAIGLYVEDFADPVVQFSNRQAAQFAYDSEGRIQAASIRNQFALFIQAENDLSNSRERAADSKSSHAIELGVVGLTGSAILILLFAIYLARGIARPVTEAAAGAGQVAAGDLSIRLSQKGPGEVGEFTKSFNEMAERLESTRNELEDQNAQLRESERLKSDLVNTVSHELRTPLSGVMGFTKLLLTREFDPETRRHYLGIVDAQARRLSNLLDDFLDVRRIEEGRFRRSGCRRAGYGPQVSRRRHPVGDLTAVGTACPPRRRRVRPSCDHGQAGAALGRAGRTRSRRAGAGRESARRSPDRGGVGRPACGGRRACGARRRGAC